MLTALSRTITINITEDMQSPIFRIAINKYGVSMTNSWTLTFGPLTIFGCIINNIQKSKWTLSDIMLIIKLNIKISDICWKKKTNYFQIHKQKNSHAHYYIFFKCHFRGFIHFTQYLPKHTNRLAIIIILWQNYQQSSHSLSKQACSLADEII